MLLNIILKTIKVYYKMHLKNNKYIIENKFLFSCEFFSRKQHFKRHMGRLLSLGNKTKLFRDYNWHYAALYITFTLLIKASSLFTAVFY